jgi:hypothetical protein
LGGRELISLQHVWSEKLIEELGGGDALLAGVGTDHLKYEDIFDWVKISSVAQPKLANSETYQKYYALHRKAVR